MFKLKQTKPNLNQTYLSNTMHLTVQILIRFKTYVNNDSFRGPSQLISRHFACRIDNRLAPVSPNVCTKLLASSRISIFGLTSAHTQGHIRTNTYQYIIWSRRYRMLVYTQEGFAEMCFLDGSRCDYKIYMVILLTSMRYSVEISSQRMPFTVL